MVRGWECRQLCGVIVKRIASVRALFASAVVAGVVLIASAPAFAQGSKPLPALTQTPPDALTRALATGELTQSEYALQRAVSLFRPNRVSARYGEVQRPDPRAVTLILRDLAIRVGQLSAADQKVARAILARPTDGSGDPFGDGYTTSEAIPDCGPHVCVHYVTTTGDAVPGADASPLNGIPDYVDQALDVFENGVWAKEVTSMGYRAPKSDLTSDNTGASPSDLTGSKFDVYLTELGDKGFYGYCTTDDPHADGTVPYNFYDMSAYCVVENDFAGFPLTPIQDLEVTAAHEFFHAVQYAYDAFEDQWLLEATATWMEDELYTDINDNLQYLPRGPLAKPSIPLDKGGSCCHVYGDWIFFRFLSEWFRPSDGTEDPTIVKQIWTKADGAHGGPDNFSIQAVQNVAQMRGTNFRSLFGTFGWANRISRRFYGEGAANSYPQSPLSVSAMTIRHSSPSRSRTLTLSHQTNGYLEFRRGSGVGSAAKLKVALNLPPTSTGAAASVLVFRKNGNVNPFTLGVSRTGDGTFRVPFGSTVAKVDVIVTNGSIRYKNCFAHQTPYACSGVSRDDGRAFKVTAHL
jgi:hypothetical protein